jgi:hypothetical protein
MKGEEDIILCYINLEPRGRIHPHPHTVIFAFFFLNYSPQPTRISEASMGGAEDGGHNMINITIRELYYTFADFFQNWNLSFLEGRRTYF